MKFVLCLLMVFAAGAVQDDRPVVEVFLPPVDFKLTYVFLEARNVVTETYAEIGVRVVWRPAVAPPPGCLWEPRRRKIVVALQATTPPGLHAETAAFARPYATEGPCVTLLMDQIGPAAKTNPISTGVLLGYVLAHEMGHVLQGVDCHSESGVMKKSWSARETVNMKNHQLHFTAWDAQLILHGLALTTGVSERIGK